ncbi:class I SAM-dependent methyltransferase [Roseiarcaceae bacterium H3SJ34-1]|uniref:class I SAM-dependent methyltransferase n=1 Tax=Terripilifer ovatus TaxID=3032367 RepID=UPI003AB93626|nr:class I SAM-dependent methyltransferase [Roseiarcaceae bacterium H3SJ34-1]
MRTLETLEELDRVLADCDAAAAVSDDALRTVFTSFQMLPPPAPADPFSQEFRAHQLDLYRWIAGRDYALKNEATAFEIADAVRRPFPYATGSCQTVGEQLMAIGYLISRMELAPGSRVLEFGPGWGNTTLALAQTGMAVTAVDIEARFCELIRRRASLAGVTVDVVNSDFMWAEQTGKTYDVVLFFECFHHCDDHLRLLRALRRVLKPGGRILFAAEPVHADFPQPWGLRLDGQSLWSIRKFGWMELGFSERYFQQALALTGWRAEPMVSNDVPWMTIWTARNAREPIVLDAADRRFATQIGEKRSDGVHLTGQEGYGLFGPYMPLPAGDYVVSLGFSGETAGTAQIDVAIEKGSRVLARVDFGAEDLGGVQTVELPLHLDDAVTDLELRLHCAPGFTGIVRRAEFKLVAED